MDTQTIFFIGKPGCGKGTQAQLLAEKTNWQMFSSGKLFREIAQEDTAIGHKIKSENDAGILQPHWFAMHLYLQSLFSLPKDANVIFDGFNRKVPEAELIIESLAWLARPFHIVYLQVSDDVVRQRLAGRKEKENRADDSVVGERLKQYYTHTEPAIELFRTADVLIEIQGEQSPEKVAEDIRSVLTIS